MERGDGGKNLQNVKKKKKEKEFEAWGFRSFRGMFGEVGVFYGGWRERVLQKNGPNTICDRGVEWNETWDIGSFSRKGI